MSEKSWLRFLFRMVDLVLEMVKEYLLDHNDPEPEKTTTVGD